MFSICRWRLSVKFLLLSILYLASVGCFNASVMLKVYFWCGGYSFIQNSVSQHSVGEATHGHGNRPCQRMLADCSVDSFILLSCLNLLPLKNIHKATSIPDASDCILISSMPSMLSVLCCIESSCCFCSLCKVRQVEQKAKERSHATEYIRIWLWLWNYSTVTHAVGNGWKYTPRFYHICLTSFYRETYLEAIQINGWTFKIQFYSWRSWN